MTNRFSVKSPLASNTNVDLDDAMKTKIALRRLGYYKAPGYGMTPYPDAQLFEAVSGLQRDKGIRRTGEVRPGDDTEKAIRLALNETSPHASETAEETGKYIWRTRGDSKVRSEHAERDGKVFDWDNPPEGGHPGEAPNCRCTAEDVKDGKDKCRQLLNDVENARLEVETKKRGIQKSEEDIVRWDEIHAERRRYFMEQLSSFGVSSPPSSEKALLRILGRILRGVEFSMAVSSIMAAWNSMDEADRIRSSLKNGLRYLKANLIQKERILRVLQSKYADECQETTD